jgi:hypothetical protein
LDRTVIACRPKTAKQSDVEYSLLIRRNKIVKMSVKKDNPKQFGPDLLNHSNQCDKEIDRSMSQDRDQQAAGPLLLPGEQKTVHTAVQDRIP